MVLADGPAVTLNDLPPEVRQPIRRRARPRLPRAAATPAVSLAGKLGFVPGLPVPLGSSAVSRSPTEPSSFTEVDRESPPAEEWNAEFLAYERQRLLDILNEAKGNKSVAARLLGIPRSTFFSKLKKHGIV